MLVKITSSVLSPLVGKSTSCLDLNERDIPEVFSLYRSPIRTIPQFEYINIASTLVNESMS